MKMLRDFLYLGGYALTPHVKGRYYGGGDSPPPASSTTTTQQVFSPEDQAARDDLLKKARSIYDNQAGAWNSMIGPQARPVGPSDATTRGQQMVLDTATGPGQVVADNAAGALNFGLSGDVLDPNKNPGFQGALTTALRRVGDTYTDPGGVISNIRSNFMTDAPSGPSSREAITMGLAGKNYLNTIGDVTSSMTSDAYNKGLDYMKSSMAFAPNMYNLMMQPGLSVGAVGAQREGYTQQQEDYDAANRTWKLQGPWAGLSPYSSVVQGLSNPATTTTGTSTGTTPQKSPAMSALSGAAMGYSIGGPWGAAAGGLLGLLNI